MKHVNRSRLMCAIGAFLALAVYASPAAAQGVTTAAMTGVVKDAQGGVIPGASIVAVHLPSGTTYEGVAQGDGRFNIAGMRIGGPYKVTVALQGFSTEVKNDVVLSLGVTYLCLGLNFLNLFWIGFGLLPIRCHIGEFKLVPLWLAS